jgi:lantibiotic biosynthesis protein
MMIYTQPGVPPPDQDPAPGWTQSLATGAPGMALLHIAYAHTGTGDWATAHQWATTLTRNPVIAHPDAGLYRGAPAVAYALRTAAQPAYADALVTLDQHVAAITRYRLNRAQQRIDRRQLPNLREFDLINGLTGIGVYLLQAGCTALLREVLAYLVRLTDTIVVDGHRMPGWWTTNGPADRPDPRWPGGHANLGLAHGISGPLALLAAAMIHGVTVAGQADAIDRVDVFFVRWRCGTYPRPWWPGMISARSWATGTVDSAGPQRPSWCYGTPGLSRARQLAARALDAPLRQRRAETDLAACIADDAQLAQLRDDSLCHGWAGLLHTTRRAASDSGLDSELAYLLPRLESRWRQRREHIGSQPSGQGGMLEGSTGVALARHSIVHATTRWDACMLTSPPVPTNIDPEGP